MSKVRNYLVLAAALLGCTSVLGFSSRASADPIAFSTTGSFGGPDASGGSLSADGYTITFHGVTDVSPDASGNVASFGSFTVTGPGTNYPTNIFATDGDTFTLTIDQINPTTGTGFLGAASITGYIYNEAGTSGTLSVAFPNAADLGGGLFASTVNIVDTPGVNYTSYNVYTPTNILTNSLSGGAAIVAGTPPITPLPKSAAAGLGLLTVLGLTRGFKSFWKTAAV